MHQRVVHNTDQSLSRLHVPQCQKSHVAAQMQSTKTLTAQAYVVLCFLPKPNISEGPDRMSVGYRIDIYRDMFCGDKLFCFSMSLRVESSKTMSLP